MVDDALLISALTSSATPAQPLHEFLRRRAREMPERAALIWYGRVMTWAQLDAVSDAFAARLQALGVAKGEPVALFMNNCPQYLVAHYGIQKMGAVVCPCGPLNKEHELAYQLGDLRARVIVAASVLLPIVAKVRDQTQLTHVFVVRYDDLLPEAPEIPLPAELRELHKLNKLGKLDKPGKSDKPGKLDEPELGKPRELDALQNGLNEPDDLNKPDKPNGPDKPKPGEPKPDGQREPGDPQNSQDLRASSALASVSASAPTSTSTSTPIPTDCEDFLAVMHSGARPAPVNVSLDDLALITYTSGSTGLPKGAMLTHGNVLFKIATSARLNALGPDDVMLAVASLYHIAGMSLGVCAPIFNGTTTVLMYRFDAAAVALALERYRVTWWYSIVPMNVALMQLPDARERDWRALRRNPVTSFGIAYTEALASQWRAFTPNCISCEAAYGLSETHTSDTAMPVDAIRWGTHGKPVPGNLIRIVDSATGEPLPAGAVGEITIHGPGNFRGYLNKPEATATTLRHGWVHTGDMGKLDAEGYLTFLGRFKEMIKVSGYSVFLEEVETILIRHPAIAQAAVIAKPDPEKGEVVCAFVLRKPDADLTADALVAWARANMAAYKVPRDVRFVNALPATGAGKLLRRMLKELL